MIVSMSAVLLLGLLIWMLIRFRYVRWLEAVLCITFGFLLAQTDAAPAIEEALDDIGDALADIDI